MLGAVEVGLRLWGYDPLELRFRGRHRYLRLSSDSDVGFEPVPGVEGVGAHRGDGINSHGFRDRDYAAEKPAGTTRVVVIGDSITFAGLLEADARYTEVLEARMLAEGRRFEILNLGVGGYDTLNEVAFLERVGLNLGPDLVIVAFCINDLGVHSINLESLRLIEEYGWLTRRLRLAQLFAARMDKAASLRQFRELNRDDVFVREHAGRIVPVGEDPEVRAVVDELEVLLGRADAKKAPVSPFLRWYTSEAKLGRLRYAFERVHRAAEEREFDVLVMIIPYLREGELVEAYARAYELVAYEATRLDFDVLNLHEAFRSEGFELLRGEGDDLHPNERGHRLMAEELHRVLIGN